MNDKPNLVLITNNYPFEADHGEIPFVRPEIPRLTRVFDKVYVVPINPAGRNLDPTMAAQLDLTLAEQFKFGKLIRLADGFRCEGLWAELRRAFGLAGFRGAKRAIGWAVMAGMAMKWAERRFDSRDNILFYTYWRTGITLGLTQAARGRSGWKVVTRVHGIDLYAERLQPPYQPFSPGLYNTLSKTFTVSQAAMSYLASIGATRTRTELARLGIEDPGFMASASSDGVLRLVSCSFMVSVKRVPLLARSIVEFARKHPALPIQWTHLGDGIERELVLHEIKESPQNLQARMMGQVSNEEVYSFYRDNHCDLFVHVSASEGGAPVAMQEASAVGIPILATEVGGVAEIVTTLNGKLLPANPSCNDIVGGLEWFVALAKEDRSALSRGARTVWETSYKAEKNHLDFAQRLLESWRVTHKESRPCTLTK